MNVTKTYNGYNWKGEFFIKYKIINTEFKKLNIKGK